MVSDPSSELVEVVDRDGNVIDVVTRAEVRANNLRHRCTYVTLVTSTGELVVHQRASWKDVYPSFWDLAFGGIAGVAESWGDAARRELTEEAGITGVDLIDLGLLHYDADDGRIVGRAYLAVHDGDVHFDDGEVVAVDRVPVDRIGAWLDGRDVCPDSKNLVLPLVLANLAAGGSGS